MYELASGEEQADNVEASEYEHYGNRTRSRRPARDDRGFSFFCNKDLLDNLFILNAV